MPVSFRHRSAYALCLLCSPIIPTAFGQEPDVVALGQLLKHPKKEERRDAAYQLLQLGESSAPAVRQLVGAMADDDDQVWTRSVMTLGAIGPKATYAIPALIDDMGGNGRYAEQHSQRCSFALSRIGSAAKPALVKALNDDNHHRRWGAVHALALMGANAAEHAPDIMALLADPDEAVRLEVADALHVFGNVSVPLLIEKLEVGVDPTVQLAAIKALALFNGDDARKARLPLLALLGQTVPMDTRGNAFVTLVQLEMDQELLAPMLTEAVLSSDDTLRDHALHAILALRNPGQHMVPTLAALLLDQSPKIRVLAADTLARMGADAAPAAHVVMTRISGNGLEANEMAWLTKLLIAMGPSVVSDVLAEAAAVPLPDLNGDHWTVQCLLAIGIYDSDTLIAALGDNSPSVRYVALKAFPDLRRRDSAAQANLRKALQDDAGALRAAARGALARGHVPVLLWSMAIDQGVKDTDARVRAATLASLSESPMSKRKRRRVVASLFHDPDSNVQREAIVEVGRLGPDAERLVPNLISVLEQDNSPHIEVTLQALAKMEQDASPSVPILASMLDQEAKRDYWLLTLKTLEAIGTRAKEALPAIHKHLEANEPDLKVAALEAFARVETIPAKLTPIFISALRDPLEDLRRPAIEGFGRLGKEANGAVKPLVKLLDSDDTIQVALEALRQIRFRDVGLYIQLMKHKSPSARSFACERLGRLGNLAEEALPILRILAEDDSESYVRRRAQDAVRRIEDKD